MDSSRGKWAGRLIVALGIIGIGALILGPQLVGQDKRYKMRDICTAAVADWAGFGESSVDWEDVSNENPSGTAWDFRGTYPAGSWACGGPAGELVPAQIVVYPGNGIGQDITP